MSINSINSYGINMSLVDYMNANSSTGETDSLNSSSSLGRNSAAKQAYGSSMQSAEGMAAIKKALGEISPNSSGAITFKMIGEYRAQKEEEFTSLVKGALLLVYGADEDVEFQLVATPEGEMQINCDDPEQKKIIEQLFEDNPDLVEEFLHLQALGNMERAQQSATASTHRNYLEGTKAGLQTQAMETFFNDMFSSGSVGYSSIMAEFGLEDADYFMGANYYV